MELTSAGVVGGLLVILEFSGTLSIIKLATSSCVRFPYNQGLGKSQDKAQAIYEWTNHRTLERVRGGGIREKDLARR
ncbi:MAG TPA: hypothetical protein VK973_14905, partial [Arenicellales bacterium]|nr:hypothetical protein [Arenicellales bacterium]